MEPKKLPMQIMKNLNSTCWFYNDMDFCSQLFSQAALVFAYIVFVAVRF